MNAMIPRSRRPWAASVAAGLVAVAACAFPPAPPHLVFGQVRDEQGNPLNRPGTEVWLDVQGSTSIRSPVAIDREPGVNYRLAIPMDSGVTSDLYAPTALRPMVPFRLRVKVGNATYLPIEMTGAAGVLTRPSATTRINLTLGIDSDGDGLPDAWEKNLAAALGTGASIADINPNADSDGDGISNLDEYLAGTYAFDAEDGFKLGIVSKVGERAMLEFMAVGGRSYTLRASDDLQTWKDVPFRLSTDAASVPSRQTFRAQDTRIVRPLVGPFDGAEGTPKFFKVFVH